jgi:hypothetical protein
MANLDDIQIFVKVAQFESISRQPAPRVVPWKLLILWSTLGVGIMLLGWMAYRLSREVSRAPAPKP